MKRVVTIPIEFEVEDDEGLDEGQAIEAVKHCIFHHLSWTKNGQRVITGNAIETHADDIGNVRVTMLTEDL